MRVIAGRAKGRRLFGPAIGVKTRPITDRAKESLFGVLGPEIENRRFLDLFAGTGSVGIEALSRGARDATFVEYSQKVLKTLRRNLIHTELKDDATVVQADVLKYLTTVPETFDFVFIAPPQYHELWSKTLLMVDSNPSWLSTTGIIIVQIDPSEFRHPTLSNLIIQKKNVTVM